MFWSTALSTLLYEMSSPEVPGVLRIVHGGYLLTEAMVCFSLTTRSLAAAVVSMLEVGDIITALESRLNERGHPRIRWGQASPSTTASPSTEPRSVVASTSQH